MQGMFAESFSKQGKGREPENLRGKEEMSGLRGIAEAEER